MPIDIDLGAPLPPPSPPPSPPPQAGDENILPTASEVDVLLLLEGTFPYVSGGVSSWVNQLMLGFPHLRFGAIFIGSRRADYKEMKYKLPANLAHLECHFLHEPPKRLMQPVAHAGDPESFAQIDRLHQTFRDARHHKGNTEALLQQTLAATLPHMGQGGSLSKEAFNTSEQAWQRVLEHYRAYCTDPSFVDYFWSVRIMHAPLWTLLHIAQSAPRCRALHTISTGYAGMLGAMLAQLRARPLILSEHGIYTKERRIDLFQSTWIRDNRGVFERRAGQVAYFKDLWIRFFEGLGRCCYASARHIVSLYEANRLRQIADGAAANRTRCIPNGIDVARFAALRRAPDAPIPPVVCLIGRVVPIKDVKTFIRALRTLVDRVPNAQGWIAGPEDEDPDYAQECRMLAETLGLQQHLKFLGFQKLDDLLPKIGLMVLSSISEGLPLVILESYAAGVPCVTTDVGSCRQLIYGIGPQDEALGAAGAIVHIADPQALAEACVPLLTDAARWNAASQAGIARVEALYTQGLMFDSYRQLYQDAIEAPDTPVQAHAAASCPHAARAMSKLGPAAMSSR